MNHTRSHHAPNPTEVCFGQGCLPNTTHLLCTWPYLGPGIYYASQIIAQLLCVNVGWRLPWFAGTYVPVLWYYNNGTSYTYNNNDEIMCPRCNYIIQLLVSYPARTVLQCLFFLEYRCFFSAVIFSKPTVDFITSMAINNG